MMPWPTAPITTMAALCETWMRVEDAKPDTQAEDTSRDLSMAWAWPTPAESIASAAVRRASGSESPKPSPGSVRQAWTRWIGRPRSEARRADHWMAAVLRADPSTPTTMLPGENLVGDTAAVPSVRRRAHWPLSTMDLASGNGLGVCCAVCRHGRMLGDERRRGDGEDGTGPMTIEAIGWDEGAGAVRLLDQTRLPGETTYLQITRVEDLVEAIRALAVRGAPALGVAGALGVVVAMDEGVREGWEPARVAEAVDRVRTARPTAVNLAWGVDAVRPLMAQGRDAVLAAALRVKEEDTAANRVLSRLGADWLLARIDRPSLRVLTHCNAGSLATSGWGTALGVVRDLHARGRVEFVYADETRPLLQGARLTAYELAEEGIPHAVEADGAAASTILRGLVDLVVVGADRIAANGDTANKIGTLGLALAAREAGIPFLVAAPWSTVDLATPDGSGIEIEERSGDEVTSLAGVKVAPDGTPGFNPAFDVTPARFVTGIATERGVVEPAAGVEPATLAGPSA